MGFDKYAMATDTIAKLLADIYKESDFGVVVCFATLATALDEVRAVTDMTATDESNLLKLLSDAVTHVDEECGEFNADEIKERLERVCINAM